MKIYVTSVVFRNNQTKIKYAGTDLEKAYSIAKGTYTYIIETWENEQLVDTDIIEPEL